MILSALIALIIAVLAVVAVDANPSGRLAEAKRS